MAQQEPQAWKSPSSSVLLVPWDPDSEDHAERLYDQRVACGWNQDKIEEWKILQREGNMSIQWVVLREDDPDNKNKLERHREQFPSQRIPLIDSASSHGGKKRDLPQVKQYFMPVGHIALTAAPPEPEIEVPQGSVYTIATFYISGALQNSGLGRAAMDAMEKMAVREPLCAKVITLNTVAREDTVDVERRTALSIPVPKIVNQDWYERRGYTVYKYVRGSYPQFDGTGKLWTVLAVFMMKRVV